MVPVGGVEVMLLGVGLSGLLCAAVGIGLARRLGWVTAWSLAGLLWSLAVIACVTLVPVDGAPGVVPAETRSETCSWNLGGPAPEGFWIFSGGQRLLNAVVFVPSGALLVLFLVRWVAAAVALVPVGLLLLAAYSAGIEKTQLELARLDRACDVTDVVDNITGAVLGVVLGILLALVLRPWRARRGPIAVP